MPNLDHRFLPLARAILDANPPPCRAALEWANARWAAPGSDAIASAILAAVEEWPVDFKITATLKRLGCAKTGAVRSLLESYSAALSRRVRCAIPSKESHEEAKLLAALERLYPHPARRKRIREFNAAEPSPLRICPECLVVFMAKDRRQEFCSTKCKARLLNRGRPGRAKQSIKRRLEEHWKTCQRCMNGRTCAAQDRLVAGDAVLDRKRTASLRDRD